MTEDERIITSVHVLTGKGHEAVSVWNRGGLAGTLIVHLGDGAPLAFRLLPGTPYARRESDGSTTYRSTPPPEPP